MINTIRIRYFLFNLFFLASLYFGFFKGNDNAKTIALIIVWFCFVVSSLSIFMIEDEKLMQKLAKKPFAVPGWFDLSFDIGIVIFLLSFDHWFAGGAYIFHTLLMMSFRGKIEDVREKNRIQELAEEEKQNKKVIIF